MPTLNKAESSRINGAKSHGPVTPEGKKRSSLNSVRHGLLAKSVCLTNESQDYFQELLQDFITRFQPADGVETRLVELMASCALRIERFLSVDTALFDHEMDDRAKETATYKKIDHATEFALAFKSLADNSNSLQLYMRYITTTTRQYDRALKQLLDLRAKVPIPAEAEIPDEPNEEQATTNNQPRASALPNEPTGPPKHCEFNTKGVCTLGPDCPEAHLHKKIA